MKVLRERLIAEREGLRDPIRDCVERARGLRRRQWLSVRFSVSPRDVLEDFLSARVADAFYWEQPSRDQAILGLGRLETIEGTGRERFCDASRGARDLFDGLTIHDLDEPTSASRNAAIAPERGPLLLGGFAFSDREVDAESEWHDLGAGRLVLPEIGVVVREDLAWMTRTCSLDPEDRVEEILDRLCSGFSETAISVASEFSTAGTGEDVLVCEREGRGPEIRVQADRPHDSYLAQVAAALEAIEAGKLEKVVLARSLRVRTDHDFDLTSFLGYLRESYPSCTTLAVREGGCWFISATPERLVALEDDEVSTAAVAGSAPRGRSHDEDARFGTRLLESDKERAEHEVVERAIREALLEKCGPLIGVAEPRLLKLEGIQHLESRLRGCLLPQWRGRISVLDLVGALHPTPAVAGAPCSTALDWLDQHEALDRGWYAGPVGYVDAKGDGEFCVALRSALLRRRSARLFAGAGIVSDSSPRAELSETRLKLRALLAPLTEI